MQSFYHLDPVLADHDGVFALDLDDAHHAAAFDGDYYDKSAPLFDPAYGDMISSDATTFNFANWLHEPLEPAAPTAPIPIPSSAGGVPAVPDTPESPFRTDASFSPSSFSPFSDFAALPASPTGAVPLFAHPGYGPPPVSSVSPPEAAFVPWPEHLYGTSPSPLSPSLALPPLPVGDDDATVTQRRPIPRRRTTSITQLFQSSSAPAPSGLMSTRPHMHMLSRPYSRRAESVSLSNEDRDATIRARRKRPSPADDPTSVSESGNESGASLSPAFAFTIYSERYHADSIYS
jgi:hypothetical protein